MNIKDKWNNASTRTKVIIIAVMAFVLLGIAGSATAGNPTPGTYDECIYGDDCGKRFGYTPPKTVWPDCDRPTISNATCQDRTPAAKSDDKTPTTRPKPDPQPKPKPHPEKPEPKPEGKPHDKPKGNASANDGKGGKTRDGSKNDEKGRPKN